MRLLLARFKESIYEQKMAQAKVLNTMAASAPAFGMVCTLVGLIIMLNSMDGDPSKIGGGLAVALLTMLYGVLLAQLVLKPAARKVEQKQDLEAFLNQVLTERIVITADGALPSVTEDSVNVYPELNHQFSRSGKLLWLRLISYPPVPTQNLNNRLLSNY